MRRQRYSKKLSRLAVVVIASFSVSRTASAMDDARTVSLNVRCQGLEAQIKDIFEIEANAEVVEKLGSAAIEIECNADQARIQIVDRLTKKTLIRSLPIELSASSTNARIVAIGAAELLGACWEELASSHGSFYGESDSAELKHARVTVLDSIRPRAKAPALPLRSGSVLVGVLLDASSARGIAWGATAQLWIDEGKYLTIGGELRADTSTQSLTLGDVSVRTLSATGLVGVHRRLAALSGVIGRLAIGFRGGAAWVAGDSSRADVASSTVSGFASSALLVAHVEAPVGVLRVGFGWSLAHSVTSVAGKIAADVPVSTEGFAFGANLTAGVAW